jgi:hypothetical protein
MSGYSYLFNHERLKKTQWKTKAQDISIIDVSLHPKLFTHEITTFVNELCPNLQIFGS